MYCDTGWIWWIYFILVYFICFSFRLAFNIFLFKCVCTGYLCIWAGRSTRTVLFLLLDTFPIPISPKKKESKEKRYGWYCICDDMILLLYDGGFGERLFAILALLCALLFPASFQYWPSGLQCLGACRSIERIKAKNFSFFFPNEWADRWSKVEIKKS